MVKYSRKEVRLESHATTNQQQSQPDYICFTSGAAGRAVHRRSQPAMSFLIKKTFGIYVQCRFSSEGL